MPKVIKKNERDLLETFSSIKSIDIDTGEFQVSSEPVIMQSIALGSCVAFVAYDHAQKTGGLAHIMLPGRSPANNKDTKYTEDAIEALLDSMTKAGCERTDLEISITGGGNVLQEGDIPDRVIDSILEYLEKIQLSLTAMRVGGIERRSVFLDNTTGEVFITEGENSQKIRLIGIEIM